MTKVYQTIFDQVRGNCMAAVWASLLNLELQQVPNFVEHPDDHKALCDFLQPLGFEYHSYLINRNRNDLQPDIKVQYSPLNEGLPPAFGFNGYYDGTVYSPRFFDVQRFHEDPQYKPVCHAVVVDKDLHIVHDPNPIYKGITAYPLANELGCSGLIGVGLYKKKGEAT
jgi:hypothetical protein